MNYNVETFDRIDNNLRKALALISMLGAAAGNENDVLDDEAVDDVCSMIHELLTQCKFDLGILKPDDLPESEYEE